MSAKRLTPKLSSRRISSDQRSPTTFRASAIEQTRGPPGSIGSAFELTVLA
jgi:hypothetical protein